MKNSVYLGVLLLGFLLFGYWFKIEPPLIDGYDENTEARLENIIERSFNDSRFEVVSIGINDGILVINLEDTEICSDWDAVYKITKNINLRDFQPSESNKPFAAGGDDESPQKLVFVSVRMESDANDVMSVISDQKNQIYYAVREELGWGQEASNRTYELFTQSIPNLETLNYEVREKCSGGIGLDLVQTSFSLAIRSANVAEYIQLLNRVIEKYDD